MLPHKSGNNRFAHPKHLKRYNCLILKKKQSVSRETLYQSVHAGSSKMQMLVRGRFFNQKKVSGEFNHEP